MRAYRNDEVALFNTVGPLGRKLIYVASSYDFHELAVDAPSRDNYNNQ